MAANRVGKTEGAGGYEMTCHLTGRYPDWWQGRRFKGPVRCWAAGKTNETTRDVPQVTLLGPVVYDGDRKTVAGTGLIRGEFLEPPFWKQGVANLVDTIPCLAASALSFGTPGDDAPIHADMWADATYSSQELVWPAPPLGVG